MKILNRIYAKKIFILIILLFISLSLLIYIKADILSINSGGSANITITPDSYVEAFHSQPIPNNTTSNTTSPPIPPTPPPVTTFGNISVSPSQINVNMLINTNVQRNITITNFGNSPVNLNISQTNLANLVIIGNTTITLAAGQTQTVSLIFVAPGTVGIYNGTINVGGINIPVSLNVVKQFILFDTNIVILNKNYIVPQGSPLQTAVTLIPMGGSVRMDVTLNYVIRDSTGKIYLTKSETVLIQSQQNLRRDFDTGSLPLGNYTIDLQLIYANGIAPSSAHFEIVQNNISIVISVIYYLIIAIILTIIIILIILLNRYSQRLNQESRFQVENNPNPVSQY